MSNASDEPVVVRTYATRWEAAIAKGVLETNGIRCLIEADDAGGSYPFPTQAGFAAVRLIVKKEDASRAGKLLEKK